MSAEVRIFLEGRVKAIELQKLIEKIEKEAELGRADAGSTGLVGEDREMMKL